jgi:hypothetical protein
MRKPRAKLHAAILAMVLAAMSMPALFGAEIITDAESMAIDLGGGVRANVLFWNAKTGYFAGTVTLVNESSSAQKIVFYQSIHSRNIYQKTMMVPPASSVREKIATPAILPPGYSELGLVNGSAGTKKIISHINLDYSYRSDPEKIPIVRPKSASSMPESANALFSMPKIFLSEKVWNDMNVTQKEALMDWIHLGGSLCFETEDSGLLDRVLKQFPPAKFAEGGRGYGLGSISTAAAAADKGVRNHLLDALYMSSFDRSVPWQSGRLSLYLMLPAITFFALLIGPGAIYACNRKLKKPILLLAVIPAISIAACISLLAVSLLSDGVSPKLSRFSTTHLDQARGKAYVNQKTAVEAPLGLRSAMEIPEHAITYLRSEDDYGNFGGRTRAENGKLKISGYILPRTPEVMAFTKIEKRREKLEVKEEDGLVSVVNGLGTVVRNIVLRDRDGRYWCLDSDLAPGASANLVLSLGTPSRPQTAGLPAQVIVRAEPRDAILAPGSYQAELADNVFGDKIIDSPSVPGTDKFVLVGRFAE